MNINGYEIKPFANLQGADLEGADLRGSNLVDAYLEGADLEGANLEGANLYGVDLRYSNLKDADLKVANLYGADLRDAYLKGPNLEGANLEGANLRGANLRGADLVDAKLPDFQIVPQEGSFIAYKKVNIGVIKLLIPEDAQRTSTLVGRKCRASYVKVLEGSGVSLTHTSKLEYKEGEFVYPDKYDDDIRVECTHGIHFFMTKKEAETWM